MGAFILETKVADVADIEKNYTLKTFVSRGIGEHIGEHVFLEIQGSEGKVNFAMHSLEFYEWLGELKTCAEKLMEMKDKDFIAWLDELRSCAEKLMEEGGE